jgi:hypothetical protein
VAVARVLDDGLTVEVAAGMAAAIERVAAQAGLCRPPNAPAGTFRVCGPYASGP